MCASVQVTRCTPLNRGNTSVSVVVPANVRGAGWTHTESEARFRELGVEVEGHVGDERPLDAMRDALRRHPCDEIILSTLRRGASRWLRMDLVARADRTFPIPVTHIEATEDV